MNNVLLLEEKLQELHKTAFVNWCGAVRDNPEKAYRANITVPAVNRISPIRRVKEMVRTMAPK